MFSHHVLSSRCQLPTACRAAQLPHSEDCHNTTTATTTITATATTTTTTHLKHLLGIFPALHHVFWIIEQGASLLLPEELPHPPCSEGCHNTPLPILPLLPQSTLTWSISWVSFLRCAMCSDSLSNVSISSCLYSYPTTSLWRSSQHNHYHNYHLPETSPGHLSCAAPCVPTRWARCRSPAACTATPPPPSEGCHNTTTANSTTATTINTHLKHLLCVFPALRHMFWLIEQGVDLQLPVQLPDQFALKVCPAQSWPGSAWWPWARCLGCSSERWGSSSGSVSLEITRGEIYLELFFKKKKNYWLGALWCSGLCSLLVIRGSWVRIPLGAYAPRQGSLSTVVSLDPRVVNGYPAGIYSLKCFKAHISSLAKARVITWQWCYNVQLKIGTAQSDWLTDWLIDQLTDRPTNPQTDQLIDSFIHWMFSEFPGTTFYFIYVLLIN